VVLLLHLMMCGVMFLMVAVAIFSGYLDEVFPLNKRTSPSISLLAVSSASSSYVSLSDKSGLGIHIRIQVRKLAGILLISK